MEKHRRVLVLSMALLLVLVVTACSKKEATIETSEKTSITTSETSSASSETSSTEMIETTESSTSEETMWNPQKAQQLREFMTSWGNSMEQQYNEYTQENNVNFYGLELPSAILRGDMRPKANDQFIEVSWSSDGESGSGYKIVAVYSDAETAQYLEKHCYLFTIFNGEPVILTTMQNQGNEENAIVFNETQNQELKEGFVNIVKGNSTQAASTATTLDATTVKNINILKGTYYKMGQEPGFAIDDEYYTDLTTSKKYKISSITSQEEAHTVYTITWDVDDFEQRYGEGSAGPGPQPFIYELHAGSQGSDFALIAPNGDSYTRKS